MYELRLINMMIFNREEFPTTEAELEKAEHMWGTRFPEEYRSFLLEHNGGQVYPNIPRIPATTTWELWSVTRFCSVGDLVLQKHHLMSYTYNDEHEAADLERFNLSADQLLAIAQGERGCYYMSLSKEQFGQLYYACYQDWDGFVQIKTRSFREFLHSMQSFDDDEFEGFGMSEKIYDSRYYITPNDPDAGIARFKEVLSFIGDANTSTSEYRLTVTEHYAGECGTTDRRILNYLFSIGGYTKGLLLYVNQFDLIMQLITEYHEDINMPHKGRYPLHYFTSTSYGYLVMHNYKLMDQLLRAGLYLDLTVKDEAGRTVVEKLKILAMEYEKWKDHPTNPVSFISEKINELIMK